MRHPRASCLLALALAASALSSRADAPAAEAAPPAPGAWDFFGLAFVPDVPSYIRKANVYGFKVGAPISFGDGLVRGLEASVLASATRQVEGLQCSVALDWADSALGVQAAPVNIARQADGLQFAIVNAAENVDGVQLGLVNVSSRDTFQIGLVNYIEDSSVPVMLFLNMRL